MSNWSGGFGNDLDVSEEYLWYDEQLTAEDLLPKFRKWLFAVSYGLWRPGLGMTVDDLAQEGYIAMWRALQSFDRSRGTVTSWVTKAAETRMRDLVRRGCEFGHEARRGVVMVEDREPVDSLESILEDGGAEIAILSESILEKIVDAYQHGDLVDAINRLPWLQRRYVILRFWGGMDTPGVAAALEMTPRATAILWTGTTGQPGARERLREALIGAG